MKFFVYDLNPVRSKGLVAIAKEESILLSDVDSLSLLISHVSESVPCVTLFTEEIFRDVSEPLVPIFRGYKHCKKVCLTEEFNPAVAKNLIDSGFSAVVAWTNIEEIVRCMVTLRDSDYYLQPMLMSYLLKKDEPEEERDAFFSKRECQILELIYNEFSAKEIADRLSLSVRTVEWYRRKMMEKVGARNMVGLVRYGLSAQLLKV